MAAPRKTTQETPQDSTQTSTDGQTKKGRTVTCKFDLGNGKRCDLPKGHPATQEHQSLEITTADLETPEIDADLLAQFVGNRAGGRDAEQVLMDEKVGDNYNRWRMAGENPNKPLWEPLVIPPAKRDRIETMLRSAAEYHDPPVQMKIGAGGFHPDGSGRLVLPRATGKRRKYDRKAK